MRTLAGFTGQLRDIHNLVGTTLVCNDGTVRQIDSYSVKVRPGHTNGHRYTLNFTDGRSVVANGTALIQRTERW